MEKHPLFGQVEFESLKLSEEVSHDLQAIEDDQNRINKSYSSRRFIIEKSGKLEIDVKSIKEACSVFGSERAKAALDKITKASELINDVRGATTYGDRIHSFTRLFTTDLKGQIIPSITVIKSL